MIGREREYDSVGARENASEREIEREYDSENQR